MNGTRGLARLSQPDGEVLNGFVNGSGMFNDARSGANVPIDKGETNEGYRWLPPCEPRQFIALWNNSRSAMEKHGLSLPTRPLYFMKPISSFAAHEETICLRSDFGRVVFEGELGIVIGKSCKNVSYDLAADYILGYTCVNDVTALEVLNEDSAFTQWTRAKGFAGFTPFGPVIANIADATSLVVQTFVNGRQLQHYGISDLIFSPWETISRISADMALYPGDVIACGTSLGVRPLRDGDTVEVKIDGIGTLRNRFVKNGL